MNYEVWRNGSTFVKCPTSNEIVAKCGIYGNWTPHDGSVCLVTNTTMSTAEPQGTYNANRVGELKLVHNNTMFSFRLQFYRL